MPCSIQPLPASLVFVPSVNRDEARDTLTFPPPNALVLLVHLFDHSCCPFGVF